MFLSCVATQQKSSSRGSPMCVTTNFMSGNGQTPHEPQLQALEARPANGVDVPESLVIEVIQGLRLENRHVDVAFPEDIVERFLLVVVGIGVPVPHVFLRVQGFRVVIEAIDPTLGEVGPQPILLRRVPNVEVVVDDEQVLLLSIRRLGSDHEESPLTLGRMNGLARLKPILADGGRVRGLGRLAPMAALYLPLLGLNGNPKSKKSYLA